MVQTNFGTNVLGHFYFLEIICFGTSNLFGMNSVHYIWGNAKHVEPHTKVAKRPKYGQFLGYPPMFLST